MARKHPDKPEDRSYYDHGWNPNNVDRADFKVLDHLFEDKAEMARVEKFSDDEWFAYLAQQTGHRLPGKHTKNFEALSHDA